MLRKRLEKLEQAIKQNQEGNKVYLVTQDSDKNRMVVSDLNFFGTIEAGKELINQHPHSTFVIFDSGMRREYSDEEWIQLAENMAR